MSLVWASGCWGFGKTVSCRSCSSASRQDSPGHTRSSWHLWACSDSMFVWAQSLDVRYGEGRSRWTLPFGMRSPPCGRTCEGIEALTMRRMITSREDASIYPSVSGTCRSLVENLVDRTSQADIENCLRESSAETVSLRNSFHACSHAI